MRKILALFTLLLAVVSPVHAQSTKAALQTEINTPFADNTTGLITPSKMRTVPSDIVNSIMPTAPVVSGNPTCFNGTNGLLKGCGVAPNVLGAATGTSLAFGGCIPGAGTLCTSGPALFGGVDASQLGVNSLTGPVFQVDTSAASAAAGATVVGLAAGSGAQLTTISTGTNESLAIDAKGTGTIPLGNVSTGAVSIVPNVTNSGTTTMSGALACGGVTPANSATGTGSMVPSNLPKITSLTVGVTTNPGHGILIDQTVGGGINDLAGIQNSVAFAPGNATDLAGIFVVPSLLTGSAYTVTEMYGVRVENVVKGSGASLTNYYALKTDPLTAGSTINQAIWTQGTAPVGINTSNAQAPLHVNANTVQNIAPPAGSMVHVTAADASDAVLSIEVFQNGAFKIPQVVTRNARGTAASPTAIGNGDFLFLLQGQGFGTSFTNSSNGGIALIADENFSATANGTRISLQATKKTTTNNNNVLTADGFGHVTVGLAAPSISACGTSPSAARGTDVDGEVTEGTTATGCTITFANTYTAAPQCTVSSQAALTRFAYTISTSAITIAHGSASSTKINWHCGGL